jgi:hypothetical protein
MTDSLAKAAFSHLRSVRDSDPKPERLDHLRICRICRLLMERLRSALAVIEIDPGILDDAPTLIALRDVNDAFQQHIIESNHLPAMAMLSGLIEEANRRQLKLHGGPDDTGST